MRLTADQVKKGILHPAQEVRDAAVFYFTDSYSTDSEIMSLVIQAVDKHGLKEAFHTYFPLRNLPQTDDTLTWLIDQLRQQGQPENEEEDDLIFDLVEVLKNAEPGLLKAHEDAIRELEAVDEETLAAIEERLYLHSFTAEKLWRELEDFCETNKNEDYLSDEDVDFAHVVIGALGRHPGVFDAKILDLLSHEVEDYTDNPMIWMEPCLVRLAGELRLQQAIPLIVKRLHQDDEILDPDCIRSLKKIGTEAVVDALASDFREAEAGFRFSAAELFEHIHSDQSVKCCVSFLEWETDLAIRCQLAQSGVMNFAEEAIEPARQLVLNNDLDPDLIEVRNAVVVASTLMGVEVPEREQWREDVKHDMEFRRAWYEEHLLGDSGEVDHYMDDEEPDDYDDYDDEPFPSPNTIVREEPKTGRNAPCPCGSGKKFKKCCMKK